MIIPSSFIVLNWIIISFIHRTQGTSVLSSYKATKIIDYHCDPSWKLDVRYTVSLVACAEWCTKDTDCKRYLYCKSSLTCTRFGDSNNCVVSGSATGCRCFQKVIACNGSNCVCPWGYYGTNCDQIAKDCSDAYNKGIRKSKFIIINIQPFSEPFEVRCWLAGGGYTNFIERDLTCSGEDFNRTMEEYETGFGLLVNNQWIGFNNIRQIMTSGSTYTMAVYAADYNRKICMAYYGNVGISSQSSGYIFTYSTFNGSTYFPDCGNSLSAQNGRQFSTYDSDKTSFNCPSRFGGGWWFVNENNCTRSFMMGAKTTDNLWLDGTSLDDRPYLSISIKRD